MLLAPTVPAVEFDSFKLPSLNTAAESLLFGLKVGKLFSGLSGIFES